MPIGDRQKLVTNIVSIVLGETAQTNKKFDWFINKHLKEYFGNRYSTIDKIFQALNGDFNANQTKRTTFLDCDAYYGGKYNFIFEFDELQHFSSARLKTFNFYPNDLLTNYFMTDWGKICELYKDRADRYRKSKTTVDFNFQGGRTAQRAYLDCFRDLLPAINNLNPTLRINEFEVNDIYYNNLDSCKKIEGILKNRIK